MKTPKCYVCKKSVSLAYMYYSWVDYLGRQRPHCSPQHKEITLAKKIAVAATKGGA